MESLEDKIARIMASSHLTVSPSSPRFGTTPRSEGSLQAKSAVIIEEDVENDDENDDDNHNNNKNGDNFISNNSLTKDEEDNTLEPRQLDDSMWLETDLASPVISSDPDFIVSPGVYSPEETPCQLTNKTSLTINTNETPEIDAIGNIQDISLITPQQSDNKKKLVNQQRAKSMGGNKVVKAPVPVSAGRNSIATSVPAPRYTPTSTRKSTLIPAHYHQNNNNNQCIILPNASFAQAEPWSLSRRRQESLTSFVSKSLNSDLASASFTQTHSNNEKIDISERKIKVAVRIRPFIPSETQGKARRIVSCLDNKLVIVNPTSFDADPDAVLAAAVAVQGEDWARVFVFNHCLWSFDSPHIGEQQQQQQSVSYLEQEYISQEGVHRVIGLELVENILNGVSSSCFAYGKL